MGYKRSVVSIVLTLVAALSISAAIFHDKNPIARSAQDYAVSIATVSAATYVTLRTINAVFSMAQEVEVGASVGVSGSFQPGKVLEPVDDTIERFASAVFSLMVLSGVLSVAMGPVGAVGGVMIAVACLLWMALKDDKLRSGSIKLGVYGAFLTLGLPLCMIASNWLAGPLTGSVLSRHQSVIDGIVSDVPPEQMNTPQTDANDDSWFDGLRDTVTAGKDYVEKGQKILNQANDIMNNADDLIRSYLSILAVLIIRVLVLPVLLIWGVWTMTRSYARRL